MIVYRLLFICLYLYDMLNIVVVTDEAKLLPIKKIL